MMQQVQINAITSDQGDLYKPFFMAGLVNDEDKFRISPNDEQKESFPTIDQPDSFTLGAFVNGNLEGVVSFERDGKTREKQRHKGTLFRMYIAPNFRGAGLAQKLIEELIGRVKELRDIEQINLTVVSDNLRALKLYQSFGFEMFSVEKNAIKWKGKYLSEAQMVLFIDL